MPSIKAEALTIEFPLYHHNARSLKKRLFEGATRRVKRDAESRVVVAALAELNFTIGKGERVALVGSNGAGKTTLLRTIAGIYEPVAGRLSVEGEIGSLIDPGAGMNPLLTGRENILIDSELHGHSRAESEAFLPAVIEFAELGEFIDRPVRTYSTGMKARLAFSMLVHIDPEILIVDEALSVGDAKFGAKATAKMRELAARGRILILVSHSMQAVRDMCTRCIWMDNGRIRMDSDPESVATAYLDEVRQVDDALLLQRFRNELVYETKQGWDIASLYFSRPSGEPISVLQAGEPTFVHAEIAGTPGMEYHAHLEFYRLDRLNVLSQRSPDFTMPATGRATLHLDIGALPLNYGVYSARVMLHAADTEMARRALCFEVVNPAPHSGGRPILVTPLSLTSEPIV